MELEFKPDFDAAMARIEAWWQREVIDRPPVSLNVMPDHPYELPPSHHANWRARWFDAEYMVDRAEVRLHHTPYLAESMPFYWPNLGPDVVATLYGAELEYEGDYTSWSSPILQHSRDALQLHCNLENVYWHKQRELTELSLQRGAGRWITTMPDLHTNGDLLAALRGSQELCLDMVEDMEGVQAALRHLAQDTERIYDDIWQRIDAAGQPAMDWSRTCHFGKSYIVQCDFICLISPVMLRETILPILQQECQSLDCSLYHLDGPGALRHLDDLLSIPELNGIQWIYGDGGGKATDWISVYQRIQAAGKCVQLCCQDLDDAREVIKHLRPEGLWIYPAAECTREEAEGFLNELWYWTGTAA